ncbi:hypothetical protein H6A18_09530 [Collinsella tanakaei]|uniref:hypothetical protein n=1 Tax=Collinsella tanakaei TaxID=626935 RepID=UPI001957A57B|nr:hypothetical protein [Collinsella tanakaei]MBM6756742.1 hypothetical protein [Collinsella tanakaei]
MMSDYEPGAGANLPAGCYDVPDASMGDTCGECARALWLSDGSVVCGAELEERFPAPADPETVVRWAEHAAFPPTEAACRDFEAG